MRRVLPSVSKVGGVCCNVGLQPVETAIAAGALMNILLVEDDLRMARLVGEAMKDAGHRVTLVHDGVEGLAQAGQGSYDVIVLDVMLPGIDGLEVCRRVRQQRCRTPILLLTARDAVPDRVTGLDTGADDYLTKPFAVAELLARVRALGRRTEVTTDSPLLRIGDLTLDLAGHSAQRGSKEIELTGREFRLLEYLMRHQGRVLSRDQICHHVWGDEVDLTSNVVETYVHYLRDKVDRGFPRPLIRTVRGVGYLLKE